MKIVSNLFKCSLWLMIVLLTACGGSGGGNPSVIRGASVDYSSLDQGDTDQEQDPVPEGFVKIPAGSFQMGCVSGIECSDDELPVHWVDVPSFYMSETEVTFSQWFTDGSGMGVRSESRNEYTVFNGGIQKWLTQYRIALFFR